MIGVRKEGPERLPSLNLTEMTHSEARMSGFCLDYIF